MVESWIFIFDGHLQLIGIDTTCNYHMWKHEYHLEMPHVSHLWDPWSWYLVVGLLLLCQSICQTTWSTWALVGEVSFLDLSWSLKVEDHLWNHHMMYWISFEWNTTCMILCTMCRESSTTCRNDDGPLDEFDNYRQFLNCIIFMSFFLFDLI